MEEDSPYHIAILNEHSFDFVDVSQLTRAVTCTLSRHHILQAEITVAVVTDPEIASLHKQFMNIDGPTDVLTFDLKDNPAENARHIEGDVVVSADTATREAAERGHSVTAEITLYGIHGVLHLLGMDDQSPQQASDMHRMEDEILSDIGAGTVYSGLEGSKRIPGMKPQPADQQE